MAEPQATSAAAPSGPAVEVRPAVLEPLTNTPSPTAATTPLDALRDVPITITAQLGHTVVPIGQLLKLAPGAVLELEESIGTPVLLTVRGVPFARGEIVVVNDHFAVRITQLSAPSTSRETP
ncbi:MAG: FliM/FliN family flagellar motor switch protein [Gemmataceae bacterium]|nr:FliM/FliN family flagellar motor switch protein [Gemmataceae bacterium]MDW8242220.1 FliM/FliN family flagellar motor switch protein [Thermogemmata sp.]